jgi:hypothetical protein
MLGVAWCVAMLASSATALPEPKVTITYSLMTADGGGYYQQISNTPLGAGDVDFVFDVVDSGDLKVDVLVASHMYVTMEFTADAPGGNIVDGPVELVWAYFDRVFEINSGLTLVHTDIMVWLARKGTGTLSGSTITWDNTVAPYQESALGFSDCTGSFCGFAGPWPRDLDGYNMDVPLPNFTVLTDTIFGDSFISDNGTPGDGTLGAPNDRLDDIDRPDPDATVKDTWVGVEVPEPSREVLLLAGALGLVGLGRLRERGMHRR